MSITATQLSEVQAAITAVLKAQEYEFEGRRVKRADLGMLQQREQYLEEKLAREQRGNRGPRVTGVSIRHG